MINGSLPFIDIVVVIVSVAAVVVFYHYDFVLDDDLPSERDVHKLRDGVHGRDAPRDRHRPDQGHEQDPFRRRRSVAAQRHGVGYGREERGHVRPHGLDLPNGPEIGTSTMRR